MLRLLGELPLTVATMEQPRQVLEPGAISCSSERQRIEVRRGRTLLRVGRIVDGKRGIVHDPLEHFQLPVHLRAEIGRALQTTITMQPATDGRPLLAFTLQIHPVPLQQAAHPVVMRVDPLRTALDVLAVDERVAHRPSAPTDSRAGFDQLDIVPGIQQLPRRGQAREAGTNDDDLQDARQPPASVDAICDDESPDFRNTEYTNANDITVTPNKTTAAAPTNGLVVLFAVPMT